MPTTCQTSRRARRGRGGSANGADERRRLALLRRLGLFSGDTKGAVLSRAATFGDLEAAYRLVHDTFMASGYILPRASGIRVRPFEADPATGTFIAKAGGKVVGVQSLVVGSQDLGLPSDHVFFTEISALWEEGKIVCEATNEAVSPAFRRSAVPTELMRCLFAEALRIDCHKLITTVSPGHRSFYECLGFEQIGGVRNYSTEVEDPVVLMCWHLDTLQARYGSVDPQGASVAAFLKRYYLTANPYRRQVAAWARQAEATFAKPRAAARFFRKCPELFLQSTAEELEAIRHRLGEVPFALASGDLGLSARSA